MMPLDHHKRTVLAADKYSLKYGDAEKYLFENMCFEVNQGDRAFLNGANGCGKSSLIKAVLRRVMDGTDKAEKKRNERRAEESGESEVIEGGRLWTASGLAVSYISQDTSFLRGSVKEFCKERNLDESLFLAILRQLDMERVQFEKRMQDFSEGQKKKVLLAASLLTPAHLYIWDEPLNYIDVFSRMQVEELLLTHRPTMLVVDHDVRFVRKIATKLIDIPS